MGIKNYYTILGVGQSDSVGVIKAAYRELAKKYHPDLNPGDTCAQVKMQEISQAWETLGDVEKRKKYDESLSVGGKKRATFTDGQAKAHASGRAMTQEDFMNITKGFESIFSPGAIKETVGRKTQKNVRTSLKDSVFFEQVIGFNTSKKK